MVPAISLTFSAVAQARLFGQEREPQLDAVGFGLDLGLAAGVGELGQVGGGGLLGAGLRELGEEVGDGGWGGRGGCGLALGRGAPVAPPEKGCY